MPNVLRRLKIREVSSVDRGAGEGVHVVLFKRALSERHPNGDGGPSKGKKRRPPMTLFAHQQMARAAFDTDNGDVRSHRGASGGSGDRSRRGRQRHLKMEGSVPLAPAVKAYLKREFSGKDRKRLASTGAAMPGGGYPIENVGDLHNAIQAIGRAKNPGKTRAHVRRRAAALGQSNLIPESWGKTAKRDRKVEEKCDQALVKSALYLGAVDRLMKNAVSFNEMLAEMSSTDYAEGVVEAIRDACHAIKDSIESIAECDDLMPDERASAISESFGQFMDHLSGIAPGNVTKALKKGVGSMSKLTKKMAKAFTSVPAHSATPPTKDKDTKVTNDADKNVAAGTGIDPPKTATTKQLRKAIEKLEKRFAKTDRRLTAALSLGKAAKDYMDDPDADMDEDKKKAFLDLTPEERAKFMKKNPLEKLAQKRVANLPDPIRKQLAQSAADTVELAKRVEADELREFGKRATDVGQPEAFGASLRVLAKGLGTEEERTKAFDEVMKALTAAAEQARTAGLFKEFGNNHLAAGGSAWDQLMAKAEELRTEVNKTAGARPLTPEMAFAKVYEDPVNAALVTKYNQERRRAA